MFKNKTVKRNWSLLPQRKTDSLRQITEEQQCWVYELSDTLHHKGQTESFNFHHPF